MTTPTASGTEAKPKRTRFHARIEKAIAHNAANERRKSFHVTYHKQSTGRITKRKIDPLTLKGNVLVAYDHKRKAIRSFKLERLKHMEKSAFWQGFVKRAGTASELAGLGMLAVPSVQHLRGKDMSEDTKAKLEVAGLGTLAAPYVHQAYQKAKPMVHPLVKKLKGAVMPIAQRAATTFAKAAAQGK